MMKLPARAMRGLLLVVAMQLAFALPAAAEYVARHGLTGAQYQEAFDDLVEAGFRLASISGYEARGGARFAALWVKESGSAWAARHGLTSRQYQAAFNDLTGRGYRLTYINGYAIGDDVRYAAIWERRSGPAWAARHGLTAAEYQAVVDDMVSKGFAPTHVSVLSVRGSPRFAAIFEKGGPAWVARHGLAARDYQRAFDTFARQGFRLKVVSGYRTPQGDRYAAIWTKESGPQWSARHGIRERDYQHVFDNYHYSGWEPDYIEVFNASDGVRFNGLWHNTTFSSRDLDRIDGKVRAYMREYDAPALSIAISRNGALLYARAYGFVDREQGEVAGPKHRFRIASVSKPITHVAVETLRTYDPGERVFGRGSILGGQFATPANNPDIEDLTVGQLIAHRGGFVNVNEDGKEADPMFAYTGSTHGGLIKWALDEYPLGFTPGNARSYSNFGYCLLGRVIEAKSGKSYEAYVRDAILRPAGASGMVIGGDKEADRRPNEAKYYGAGAYSSVKPVRFDSHGGWIATPIDLLRFMRHQTVLPARYFHSGAMAGTKAVLRSRTDGFAFAAASNTGAGSTTEIDELLTEIVDEVSWPNRNLF